MEGYKRVIELPERLPVLPVRNTVMFPNAAVPLIVGRKRSVEAIRQGQKLGDIILVVAQRDGALEDPSPEDLYRIGVVCLISKLNQVENEGFQLIANGLFRYQISQFEDTGTHLVARGRQLADPSAQSTARLETLAGEIKGLGKAILSLAAIPGSEALAKLFSQLQDPAQIADLCSTFLHLPIHTKQELLETTELDIRLERLLSLMLKEKEKLILSNEIQTKMMERLSKDQRDHLLREQLRTIHEELGDEQNLQDEFNRRIEEGGLSPEAKKVARDELARLTSITRTSPEYHVIRTYLETMLALPWAKRSATETKDLDLNKAREILDADHFGIEKVKSRIMQFLAVAKLKKDLKGPILCLLGPPGVGKTSIGKSIAKALGRSFIRTSLGGVRDEAEIRGHRRTYIGAMPGRVLQSLKRAGVRDPLVLLDEIDKLGADFRGDPASALLEVLDPEQNHAFLDHYIDVPFDLSSVFFVTTANILETIPPALRDRLEVIEMTSYSKSEKMEIARRHLIPKVMEDHGILPPQLTIPEPTLERLIEGYTREAGVRNLQRELAHLCRAAAEELAKPDPPAHVEMSPYRLETVLGARKFHPEVVADTSPPGVVTGLAWTPAGGEILRIEVTRMQGKGSLMLTGQLGDVMKESAQIALSLIRSQWGQDLPFPFDKTDLHIHVPSGAIPKDGPSAGLAIFLALSSLISHRAISSRLALTGEITLSGGVMPVGGIKEKIIAAHRAGVREVCLPLHNEGDLREVSAEARAQLKFHLVREARECLEIAGLSHLVAEDLRRPITSATQVELPLMAN